MQKVKTHKATSKRFKLTKKGKIIREHQMDSHLKTKKRKSRRRRYEQTTFVNQADLKKIKKILGSPNV